MFNTDPSLRPNINELMFHLENISQTRSINLSENLTFLKITESLLHNNGLQGNISNNSNNNNSNVNNIATSAMPNNSQNQNQSSFNTANWMGNAFKGNSIFKTIKDASSKVIDSVQSSINRTDLDLTYLTPRLIVMSCPTEGIESAAFGNNIDLLRDAIQSKHGKNYRIYNLANKIFRKEKFSQVIDLGAHLSSIRAPPISLMCKLCSNIVKFLKDNPQNVCVITCNDGKSISAMVNHNIFILTRASLCKNFLQFSRLYVHY